MYRKLKKIHKFRNNNCNSNKNKTLNIENEKYKREFSTFKLLFTPPFLDHLQSQRKHFDGISTSISLRNPECLSDMRQKRVI